MQEPEERLLVLPDELLCTTVQYLRLDQIRGLISRHPGDAGRIRDCVRTLSPFQGEGEVLTTALLAEFPRLSFSEAPWVVDGTGDDLQVLSTRLRGPFIVTIDPPYRTDGALDLAFLRLSLYPGSPLELLYPNLLLEEEVESEEEEGSYDFQILVSEGTLYMSYLPTDLEEAKLQRFVGALPSGSISRLGMIVYGRDPDLQWNHEDPFIREIARQPLTHVYIQYHDAGQGSEFSNLFFAVADAQRGGSSITTLIFTTLDEEPGWYSDDMQTFVDLGRGQTYPSVRTIEGAAFPIDSPFDSLLRTFPNLLEVPVMLFQGSERERFVQISHQYPTVLFRLSGTEGYRNGVRV